ncbi:D-inositol-3-phosphate glycosyltransferase [soil metagenome]
MIVKRVAYLSMHTSPLLQPGSGDAGGMNVFLDQLSRTMAARGVAVEVYTRLQDVNDPRVVDVVDGYRVIHVPAGPPHPLAIGSLPRFVREFAGAVIEDLRNDPPQILHSHYWLSGWAGLLVKRALGIPLANSFHTLGRVKNESLRPDDAPESLIRIAAEHEVIAASDCVMASTPAEAAELLEFYGADPNRLCTSPPGVDHRIFRPGSKRGSRRRLGLGSGPVLAFVGRIQPLKGVDVALASLPLVHQRYPDATLLIVGGSSGPRGEAELQKLRHQVHDLGVGARVKFVGPLPHGLLPDLYRAADVVLVPSRSESFGLVAVEAQACGIPVVASNAGGFAYVVDDGVTGFLVAGHDPELYADRVVALLDDPALAEKMGTAAVQWAKRFSWDGTVRRYLELYRDVIPRENNP